MTVLYSRVSYPLSNEWHLLIVCCYEMFLRWGRLAVQSVVINIMGDHEKVQPHILKKFDINKKIGSGAYGIVWKVIDRRSRKPYALKKNFDAFQNSTDAQRTYREIMFLKRLKHPNIVQIKRVIGSYSQKDIYILFEFMDIDLYTLIRERLLGQQHKRYIIYQIAKALYYLHTAELIHRDIKPSNVLVNEDCLAKLCDFGLVRSVNEDDELPQVLTQYIATRWYRAPEILLGSKHYSYPADVWSFGCMIGEIIRGKPMFPGHSTLNQIERVLTWTGPPSIEDLKSLKTDFGKEMLDILTKIKPLNRNNWLTNCPPEALDLIDKTLNFNPEKRPTMLQVLKHPYLKQFYSKKEIIEAEAKITVQVDDNKKLGFKDYKGMIYNFVEEDQQVRKSTMEVNESVIENSEHHYHFTQPHSKTVYKNRFGKAMVRSASKNKDQSMPKSTQKESHTVNIKKKYESLMGKTRFEMGRTKVIKTEEQDERSSFFPKRKKSDNIVKYYTADKRKKSVSLYEAKRDSEMLAKYMLQNRKL